MAVDTEHTPGIHRILIVDDERNILNAVRRELSTPPLGRHRYEIECFDNPLEALERAGTETFEVVISDYRMPEMDGLTFLKSLARLQPDCARVVLSGQTDFDALVRMINETHIYRFIPKPWSSYFLKSTVGQAVDFRQTHVENRRLAKVLREHGIDLPIGGTDRIDHILVVDDDPGVAHAISRTLVQRGWLDDVFQAVREEAHGHTADLDPGRIRVEICHSAEQALKLAEETTFSCVIADYHMPGGDGTGLLASLTEKQPDCAGILISGVVTMESLVTALDLAHIEAFIPKPWTEFELRAAVAQALARRRIRQENRILAEMCRARDLGAVD